MAGAGYKLFNTGDVLTAAQVNTYLMEQTVMVFADAAARTTALTGVVSEGMISYLKDTNAVEVYNGSAWVASDDPNAIQNTIVDAKGDLITATAADTPARLAVGNNGETLVADSSTSTGLRWQGSTSAGRNVLINGNYDFWQRGTSLTSATSGSFLADRWQIVLGGTSISGDYTRDTSVPNFQSKYSAKVTQATGTATSVTTYALRQMIEGGNCYPFIGKQVTISFWYRSNKTGTHGIRIYGADFTGGTDDRQSFTVSAADTWEKKTITSSAFANVSAFNVGTTDRGAILDIGFRVQDVGFSSVSAADYFQIAQVQMEVGSVATPFSLAAGTLAVELDACMRYFRSVGGSQVYETVLSGTSVSTTSSWIVAPFPVQMRTTPTISYSALSDWQNTVPATASQVITGMSISTTESGTQSAFMNFTHSANGSFGSNKGIVIQANNTTNARITWSAEL